MGEIATDAGVANECRIQMTSHLMRWFDKFWCQSGSCTLKSWATIRWTSPSLAPLPFPEWHSTGRHITDKISHDSQLLVLKRSWWIRILGNLFKITKITVTQYPLSAVFGLVIVTHHPSLRWNEKASAQAQRSSPKEFNRANHRLSSIPRVAEAQVLALS